MTERENNVLFLRKETDMDIPVERVLESAIKENLKSVAVLGFSDDGSFHFASNTSDTAYILFLLELAKQQLLNMYKGESV